MKLKRIPMRLFCALPLLAMQPVWALSLGPSTNINVKGKIEPRSCAVQLMGSNPISFGNISSDNIKDESKGTDLGNTAAVPFKITCNAPTQVGISFSDNRSNSVVKSLTVVDPLTGEKVDSDVTYYGLGTSGEKNIGSYVVSLDGAKVAENAATVASVNAQTLTVAMDPADGVLITPNSYSLYRMVFTWFTSDHNAPAQGDSFSGTLKVRATVNKKSELDFSSGVELDGNATMTVYYL
jgi:hypothetical protein